MSVLIKGIKAPKDCGLCPCNNKDLYYCMAAEKYVDFDSRMRPYFCPLVELPEHHGRLVDANVIEEKMIPLSFSVQKWINEVALDTEVPTVIDEE